MREGYIEDFISGLPVRDTPEERDAVQVFARRLVEDFSYPKNHIQTRPQFHVRRRPSDSRRSYPVDIAVFSDSDHAEEKLQLVVECKKKNRRDGRRQLEIYLTMSHALVGAWFNGVEHLYLHKQYLPGGEIHFVELPSLPRHGQRVEDIGKYLRRNLVAPTDLKSVFKDIRNHVAPNATGITRDEAIAQQVINILFCKIYDELDKGPDEFVSFRMGVGEEAEVVHERVLSLFAEVKQRYADVFTTTDTIELDPQNLAYVVGELQNYAVTQANRDAIGDAFEVFVTDALKGSEGQFFTPRNVVRMMVDILDPQPGEKLVDPACGSGGFLIVALEHIWQQVEKAGKKRRWSEERIDQERRYIASQTIRGIDKDRFLAKIAKAYMAIIGDGRGGIFCENSLQAPVHWDAMAHETITLGTFDVAITNPPFGTKQKVKGREVLAQYPLGHKFSRDRKTNRWNRTDAVEERPSQLLFIDRCLQLLRPGGRMGIVLPESIFGMPTYTFVVQYLRAACTILGIVSMPEDLFQPHTHAKTCVVFIKNEVPQVADYPIFMSVVQWCGHDSRGNPTIRRNSDGTEELLDDVPNVAAEFGSLMGNAWS